MVITGLTRNQVALTGSWVRIPPLPPKKHRNFDTMGIRIAVLSFCLKALISRAFGLLICLLLLSRTIAHRQSSPQRHRMAEGYRLFLWLPFNLWAIVYLYLTSDNLPYEKIGDEVRSLADEVPFDIPDSWEWVRLIDVCEYIQRGKSPKYSPIKKYPVIAQKCNQWSGFSIEKAQFIEPDSLSSYGPERLLQDNDLMWNSTGLGTLGRMAIYKTVANPYELAVADSHVTIIRPLKQFVLPEYLYYYFANPTVQSVIEDQADGTTKQKELATSTIKAYLTPIPPLDEQRRILTKLSEVLPVVKSYGAVYDETAAMQEAFPERLKKSILQEAVQGKLVPQDPSDEPAEDLLERIRAEKQRLIKEGKIKKDKHESVIFRRDNSHYEKRGSEEVCIDDEIPFEIPENWAWCRASSLGTMVRGRGIKRTETATQGCPCIRYGEIYTTYETSFDAAVSFVPESLDKDCLHFSSGDVVFTLTGENKVDIAKTVAFLGNGQIAAGGDLAFWTHHGMNPLYLVYYMASPYCIELKRRMATGDIIVHISTSKVGNFLVPVPPLDEQDRIVSAIEQLFAVASTL